MRTLYLALLFLGGASISRAQTVPEWLAAAPRADLTFTKWDGDSPSPNDNSQGSSRLPQSFYGYLDLSRVPANAFPIKLRLLYDSPYPEDIAPSRPGELNQLKPTASISPELVVLEHTYAAPSDARVVPVWNSPLPLRHSPNYGDPQESIRAEIVTHTGALAGRIFIGASAPAWFHPRAVLVNAPGADQAFAQTSYRSIAEAKRLMPDSITYLNVDTIWIDATTAADPQLTNAFWQQVLLAGATVTGHPADITALTGRLGLTPLEPILLGRLISADSPEAFTLAQGSVQVVTSVPLQHYGGHNPFAFSAIVGKAMHSELLDFSYYYLGIFLVLQTGVIIGGFLWLRGTARVWLWPMIPAFAFVYTAAGIAVAHFLVHSRSEGRLAQVELQIEGWPQALLLTHLEQISLADRETILKLPPNSFPFNPRSSDYYNPANQNATFTFSQDGDSTHLYVQAHPATRFTVNARSLIDAKPPCTLDANGYLTVLRSFSGAWVWDGTSWHILGPLAAGQKIRLGSLPIITPATEMNGRFILEGEDDEDFPSVLKPLLNRSYFDLLWSAKQDLFLGVVPVADVDLEASAGASVESRRVVAYQFHASGGQP